MKNIKYTISQSKVLVELIICILTAAIMVWAWIRYGYSSGASNNSHALVIESLRSNIAPEPFERFVYLSLLVILPIYFSTNIVLKRLIVENTKPFICVALAFLSFLIFDFSYLKVLFGDIEAYAFFQPAAGLLFPVVYVLAGC